MRYRWPSLCDTERRARSTGLFAPTTNSRRSQCCRRNSYCSNREAMLAISRKSFARRPQSAIWPSRVLIERRESMSQRDIATDPPPKATSSWVQSHIPCAPRLYAISPALGLAPGVPENGKTRLITGDEWSGCLAISNAQIWRGWSTRSSRSGSGCSRLCGAHVGDHRMEWGLRRLANGLLVWPNSAPGEISKPMSEDVTHFFRTRRAWRFALRCALRPVHHRQDG